MIEELDDIDVAYVGDMPLIFHGVTIAVQKLDPEFRVGRLTRLQITDDIKLEKLKLIILLLQDCNHALSDHELIKKIVDVRKDIPLACISLNSSPLRMYQVLKNGADAFIPGVIPMSQIKKILKQALKRRAQKTTMNVDKYIDTYIDDEVKEIFSKNTNHNSFPDRIFQDISKFDEIFNRMTARQFDIFQLLGEGLSNKQIARKLEISDNTVRNHLAKLLKLFLCTNRTQLGILSRMLQEP